MWSHASVSLRTSSSTSSLTRVPYVLYPRAQLLPDPDWNASDPFGSYCHVPDRLALLIDAWITLGSMSTRTARAMARGVLRLVDEDEDDDDDGPLGRLSSRRRKNACAGGTRDHFIDAF